MDSNKCVEVHVGEETHDKLAVHAISDTSVARNRVAKVLDLEGTLKAGSKETTERSDERSESGQVESVNLHRRNREREVGGVREEEQLGHLVCLGEEDRVGIALEAGEDVGSQVVDRADEELGSHHDVGEDHGEDDGHDPSTNETLDGLLGRQLDELSASEHNTADVSEDVIGDDKSGGQEEPNHALEYVVHDEVGLNDNEVQSHVCPGKVGELELVVASLERGDKEDKTEDIEDEADEAVVSGQRQQDLVNQNNVLEVVNDSLAVEEVHGSRQPVPVETLSRSKGAGTAGDVGDGNDLLERDDLYSGNNGNDVDVSHKERGKEQGEHDKGPESASYEVGLLLFVLGLLLANCWRLLLVDCFQLARRLGLELGGRTTIFAAEA